MYLGIIGLNSYTDVIMKLSYMLSASRNIYKMHKGINEGLK